MVYDYLAEDEIGVAKPELQASLSVQDAPLTNMLLVNHQMKNEYHINVYRSPHRCLEPDKLVDPENLIAIWTNPDGWKACWARDLESS